MGRTAQVFAWAPGWVLKLFQPWVSASTVAAEERQTAMIRASGVPAPAVGQVVTIGGRLGLVLERVDGPSLMDRLVRLQDSPADSARQLAQLHQALLQRRAPASLPVLRDRLRQCLISSDALLPAEREAAMAALARLPPGDQLCHGDFHPGNVLLAAHGPVIIDWINASRGPAAADVARTVLLIDGSIANPAGVPLSLTSMREYREAYVAHCGTGPAVGWPAWMPVLAAVRLTEGIEELREWLRAQVREGFGIR